MCTSVDCSWASVWTQRCRASLAALSVSAALPSPSLTLSARLLKSASACSPSTHYLSSIDEICIAADLLWSVIHSVLEMICQSQKSIVACKLPSGPGRQTKLQGAIRGLCNSGDKRGTSTVNTYTLHAISSCTRGKQPGDILGEGTRGQHLMGAVLCLVKVTLQVSTSALCPVNAPFSLLAYLL